MAHVSDQASGSIYDLGYRKYEGVRLGRRQAITALYIHSLRGVFGLGRHTSSKIIPFALAAITLIPATIQLGIAAIAADIIDFVEAADYYEFIQWPMALFVAAVAPEAVGRDQRTRTLSLYFSRALLRGDYALAKVAALMTALLVLALVPQTVLFAGNAFAGNDARDYVRENWKDVAPIFVSGALLALFMASVALAIAAQTASRALASGGIIAYFAVTWLIGAILASTFEDGPPRFSLLFSGFHVIRGFTLWFFGVTPRLSFHGESDGPTGDLALADLPLFLFGLAAVVTIALALFVLRRRYQRISL